LDHRGATDMAPLLPGIVTVMWLLIAQQPSAVPEEAATANIFSYGDVDKTCMQWTDGCRNCSRGTTGQSPNCSNIGIACQPQEKVTCLSRTPDSAKPEDAKR
jgi:hypothetical protein